MMNDIRNRCVLSCRMYSVINKSGESLVKSQWVSHYSLSFSLRECTFSLSFSPFSLPHVHVYAYAHCALTRRFNVANRALVPRYPYVANGNGRISFCTVVCIDSVVHSPLYARCVLGFFSLTALTYLAKYEMIWNAVFARWIWNVSFPEFEFCKKLFAYWDRLFILLEYIFFSFEEVP